MAIPGQSHPTIFPPTKTQHTVLPNVENSPKSLPGSRVRRAGDGRTCGGQGKCSAGQTWTLKSLSERREGQRFLRPGRHLGKSANGAQAPPTRGPLSRSSAVIGAASD
jgi:hypothetical protein